MKESCLIQKGDDVILHVRVLTASSTNEIIGTENGELKIRLRAIREKGKANKALIEFLADFFSQPKSSISIIAGQTSNHKKLVLSGRLVEDIKNVLHL